jgi:hypothetical protein
MDLLTEEMKQDADADQCLKLHNGVETLLLGHDKELQHSEVVKNAQL